MALALAVLPAAAWAQLTPRTLPPEAVRILPLPAQVQAMMIDPRGFLWLGTSAGLTRYDGVAFRQVGREEIREPVVSLAASSRGFLWIGTASGRLFSHHLASNRTQLVHVRPANEAIVALAADALGNLWLASGGELLVGRDDEAEQGPISLQPVALTAEGFRVRHMRLAEDGAVWLATDQGPFRCSRTTFAGCARAGPNVDVTVLGAAFPREAGGEAQVPLVVAMSSQVMFVMGGGKTQWATELVMESLSPPLVAAMPYDGGALLADNDGLAWTDGSRIVRYRLPGIPIGAAVDAATLSSEGDVWLAVQNVGVVQVRREVDFQLLGVSLGEFPRPVFSLAFDHEGALWQNAGNKFKRWDHTHWTDFTPPSVLTGYSMRGLSLGPSGDFWTAPFDRGLIRFADGEFTRALSGVDVPFDTVLAVFHDRRERLWISGAQGGLAYREGEGPFVMLPGSQLACAATSVAMVEEPSGAVLFASAGGGLCRYERERLRTFTKADGLPSNELRALHLDEEGNLWIGTLKDGLVVRRQQTFTAISQKAGLAIKDVSSIVEDRGHDLWLGTHNGILKINKADLLAFLDGRRSTVRHLWFRTGDGLRNVVFMAQYPPAALRGPDGALYFPSHAGVLKVPHPEEVRSPELPRIFIDEMRVDGRNVALTSSPVSLRSGANVEVSASAPRLRHPQRVRFLHRLEGIQKDWHESSEMRVAYGDLPPGSYVLRLATASDDQDGIKETSVALVVRQALYLRPWFWGSVLVLLLVAAYRLRVWTLRSRFEVIAGERTRIARDMHDTLEQNLVAVKLQLEALERFAADRPQVQRHAETALNLVDQTMREAKGSIWSLRQGVAEDVDLATNLSVCAGRVLKGTEIKFLLQVEGKPYRLPIETEQQLLRLLQEGLTNIIKHAAAHTVTLTLGFGEQEVLIRLRDDGRGLAGTLPGPAQGHFGLQGMKERVAQFGGRMSITSRAGEGLEIEIRLPRPHHKRRFLSF